MRGKLEGFDTISHLDGQLDGKWNKKFDSGLETEQKK